MAILTWGKPKLEIWKVSQGETPTPVDWELFPDAKLDSSKLTTGKGTKLEALLEGGEPADVLYRKNKFTFECEIFVQRGAAKPIPDEDGVTDGFYSLRLTPEDDTLTGWQLDKTKVSVETTWTSKEGTLLKYTFEALEPSVGNVLKQYTETYEVMRTMIGYVEGATRLDFSVWGDMTGKRLYAKNVTSGNTYIGDVGISALAVEDNFTGAVIYIAYPKTITQFEFNEDYQFEGVFKTNLPIAIYIANQHISAIDAPNATELYVSGCNSLKTALVKNAGIVHILSCALFKTVDCSKATEINLSDNPELEMVTALKAESIDVSTCVKLTRINVFEVKTLDAISSALTALSIASILAAVVRRQKTGVELYLNGGTNASYATWSAQAKADKSLIVNLFGGTITNNA